MYTSGNDSLQKAGQVKIETLKLISENNTIVDLTEFLVEISIHEDIFSNYLYGNILLTDSRGIFEKLNIHGEEFLNVRFRTPGFDNEEVIEKSFRVYKITDREVVRDNNTQNFILHFVSVEVFLDVLVPLFVPFEGNITDVVDEIFRTYIATTRNYEASSDERQITDSTKETNLVIINETDNRVKFIAAGWTPFKCINWLASKAIPKTGTAKNYLFFESNKNFYFGSLEAIFQDAAENGNYIGEYFIAASNVKDTEYNKVAREFFIVRDAQMVETTDYIKNYTNGYLANRLLYLDVFNKNYQVVDYDHTEEFGKQFHIGGSGVSPEIKPLFNREGFRNPATSISFYPKNPKLFDDFSDNVNEKMDVIYGNRLSSMTELTNLKMNITVPGRTDVEIGNLLKFNYPGMGAKDSDNDPDKQDTYYSGYYLITAINHRITRNEHTMIMEIVKDSLNADRNG